MINIIIALIIDILIGDPVYPFHPIRLMGKIISFEDNRFNKDGLSDYDKFVRGIFVVVFNILFVIVITSLIIRIIPEGFFKEVFKIYLIYSSISLRELGRCARKVLEKLDVSLASARYELSMIVGRDTNSLSVIEIVRAVIETVAENTSDGVFSPLIYAFLFGPVGAMTMKMVNTMDSMIGYDDEKYFYFGKVAAITDDVINFIPARVTSFLFILSGLLLNLNTKNAVEVVFRDSKKHASLNAGYPECAMAGLLGVKLLGPATYNGVLSNKPFVGNDLVDININMIFTANRVMYVSTLLLVIIFIIWR